MSKSLRSVFVLMTLATAACSASDPAPDDGDNQDPGTALTTYTPCSEETHVGGFTLSFLEDGSTTAQGKVLGGVVPVNIREVSAEEGGCQLRVGRNLLCTPSCGSAQTCGEGGTCIAYPVGQSVGTLKLQGTGAALTLSANSSQFYSDSAVTGTKPSFTVAEALTLNASGSDAVAAFNLRGLGVQTLVIPSTPLAITPGQGVNVTWTAPAVQTAARIHLEMDVARHGGISAAIVCEGVADTGSFTIPAALTSKLLAEGVAGFPTLAMKRRTAESRSTGNTCLDFAVESEAVRDLTLPGVVSCSNSDGCTLPQTCLENLTCG